MTGLGFVFWMVVARFYSEAEVGLGAAIISAISLLGLFSRLGLDITLIRFLPKTDKPTELINSCLTLSGIVALAIAGIYIAGIGLWSPAMGFIRHNVIFSIAFVLFTIFWTLSGVVSLIFIAKRRADFTLSKSTIYSLLKVPLPIILVIYFHTFGIVASWGLATGVALAISVLLFLPRAQNRYKLVPKVNLGILKDVWRYSAGNYLANLLGAAPGLILPIMIVNLLGAAQNAYFYVAWMIAGLLFAIPGAISQTLFAEGSHFEVALEVNVRRSYRFIFMLLIPAIVIVLLGGKWFLLIFGASYSANALMLLWILAASSFFVGINSVYYSNLRVESRIRELVAIFVFVTLAVLVGSYFVTPITGIVGVGYVWIGARGLVSVYILLRMVRSYLRRRG
jgi:O-antigen/teichoic acid export membrane protein